MTGLGIAAQDALVGSRFGGSPPAAFQDHPVLRTHDYLLTLGAGSAPWLAGSELSVFLRRGYGVGDPDDRYPDIALATVLHPPSPRSDSPTGARPGLVGRALAPAPGVPVVRFGDAPERVQQEPSYVEPVLKAGYRFLFTFDEDGLPVDDLVVEEYLFGYGAAHFFGRFDSRGQAEEVVAGLIEN